MIVLYTVIGYWQIELMRKFIIDLNKQNEKKKKKKRREVKE